MSELPIVGELETLTISLAGLYLFNSKMNEVIAACSHGDAVSLAQIKLLVNRHFARQEVS